MKKKKIKSKPSFYSYYLEEYDDYKTKEEIEFEALLFSIILCKDPIKLEKWSNHENVKVRLMVSVNKKTPKKILRKLSTDKNSSVRYQIARNKRTPRDVLLKMAAGKSYSIKHYIINNPHSSFETLVFLLSDKSVDIKFEAMDQILYKYPEFKDIERPTPKKLIRYINLL